MALTQSTMSSVRMTGSLPYPLWYMAMKAEVFDLRLSWLKASNLLYLTWGLTQQTRLGNLVLLYSTLYKLIFMIDLIIFGGNGLGKSSIPSSPLLELRHSFTSRFLFTCISSRLFDGEKTLQDLNTEWAKQLRTLFYEGVKAVYLVYICCSKTNLFTTNLPCNHEPLCLQVGNNTARLIWIATKGDWPFLRKAPWLNAFSGFGVWVLGWNGIKACRLLSGFSSHRVCHLCSGEEPTLGTRMFKSIDTSNFQPLPLTSSRLELGIYIYMW